MGAEATLLISVAYPASVTAANFTVYANAPFWCSTEWGVSCSASFYQVDSIAAVRASAGNTWHFDPATGLLSLRIVQPPAGNTGSPNWSLDAGRILPFIRDGIKIERCALAATSNHHTTRACAPVPYP